MITLHALPIPAGAFSCLGAADPLSHVLPHTVARWGSFGLTNHILMLVLAALLLAIGLPIAARAQGIVPRGFRNFLEAILQYLREEVARPILGQATDRYVPLLWTFFFLILTANLLGLVPLGAFAALAGQKSALLHYVGGTATGNIMVTAGLALVVMVTVHVSGMREQGAGRYWKNFFFGHAPIWLAPLMMPLELVGSLIKAFALAMRLFANMVAGHVVVAVLASFAAAGFAAGGGLLGVSVAGILGAVAISLLEVFVAFLQAFIFTFLTCLFLGAAVHPEH